MNSVGFCAHICRLVAETFARSDQTIQLTLHNQLIVDEVMFLCHTELRSTPEMDFFTCSNCERSRRRNSSSGDEENDDATISTRQRATLRRGSGGGAAASGCNRISLCCATAVMYCYAARWRREGRSRSSKTTGSSRRGATAQWSSSEGLVASAGNLELPQLHHSSSPKTRTTTSSSPVRGSILKNSSSSSDFGGYAINAGACASGLTESLSSADNVSIPNIRRSASPDKRASFNEAVNVIVADETGRQIVADSVRLKPPSSCNDEDDDQRDNNRRRTRSRRGDSKSPTSGSGGSGGRKTESRNAKRQHYPTYIYPPASRCRHAFSLASADVECRPDGSRYLRAVIRPTTSGDRNHVTDVQSGDDNAGGRDDPQRRRRTQQQKNDCGITGSERVIVRAAAKGSRLVVGAYRPEPLGDGTNYLKQVCTMYDTQQPCRRHARNVDVQRMLHVICVKSEFDIAQLRCTYHSYR
jgi:hypothetical protein